MARLHDSVNEMFGDISATQLDARGWLALLWR
jgi:hypothetical protein